MQLSQKRFDQCDDIDVLQAAQQRMVSLEEQLHTVAAELAHLGARQTQSSAAEQSAAVDSALKQRLRKVELTVAGSNSTF